METRDHEHAAEMVKCLKERYSKLTFTGHGGALGIDIGEESEEDEGDFDEDSGYGHSVLPADEIRRSASGSRRRLSIHTTSVK